MREALGRASEPGVDAGSSPFRTATARPSRAPTSAPARPAPRRSARIPAWPARTAPPAAGRTAADRRRRVRPGPRRRAARAVAPARAVAATPSATLDVGQTSRVMRAAASRGAARSPRAADTPCPMRSAFSSSRQARTLAGPASSPPCGTASSPALAAIRNAGREVRDVAAALVVAQPEADHAAAGVRGGQPGQRAGLQRVLGAVGRDDDPDPDAGRPGRPRGRVEHQLQHRRQAAEPAGVARRVDLELQPARALGLLVLRGLGEQPADVRRASAPPTWRCRRAAGTGTSRARRRRSAAAAIRAASASGRCDAVLGWPVRPGCRAASSR